MAVTVVTAIELLDRGFHERACPNVLFVATSNFPEAIDRALLSRADVVLTVPLPGVAARRRILETTLAAVAKEFPRVGVLSSG